jgi:hypothetical protein
MAVVVPPAFAIAVVSSVSAVAVVSSAVVIAAAFNSDTLLAIE